MNLLILFGKRNVTLLFAWETQQNIVMGNMYSCQSVYYFYTTKKHHQDHLYLHFVTDQTKRMSEYIVYYILICSFLYISHA